MLRPYLVRPTRRFWVVHGIGVVIVAYIDTRVFHRGKHDAIYCIIFYFLGAFIGWDRDRDKKSKYGK
jgi:hypothetical protein